MRKTKNSQPTHYDRAEWRRNETQKLTHIVGNAIGELCFFLSLLSSALQHEFDVVDATEEKLENSVKTNKSTEKFTNIQMRIGWLSRYQRPTVNDMRRVHGLRSLHSVGDATDNVSAIHRISINNAPNIKPKWQWEIISKSKSIHSIFSLYSIDNLSLLIFKHWFWFVLEEKKSLERQNSLFFRRVFWWKRVVWICYVDFQLPHSSRTH